MGENQRETVEILHGIAFFIALKGHPFTDFQDCVKIEKLHGVKYAGAYKNISQNLFDESIKKGRDGEFYCYIV